MNLSTGLFAELCVITEETPRSTILCMEFPRFVVPVEQVWRYVAFWKAGNASDADLLHTLFGLVNGGKRIKLKRMKLTGKPKEEPYDDA